MIAALTGCAATDMQLRRINSNPVLATIPSANAADYKQKKLQDILGDFLLEPYDTTGVKETPALLQGDVTSYSGIFFPEELKKEQPVPERVKWYALAVARDYEYLGQLLKRTLAGNDMELLIDGNAEALEGAKVISISTRAEKIFGLFSSDDPGIEIEMEKFINDPDYRRSLVEKYGTPLSNFKKTDNLLTVINTWNRFDSPRGYILTPLDEKRFREIVSINPGYTHSQRLATEKTTWVFSTDPMGMLIKNGVMNNIKAFMAPTTGWDFKSKPATP
jgi:hypothetical protein